MFTGIVVILGIFTLATLIVVSIATERTSAAQRYATCPICKKMKHVAAFDVCICRTCWAIMQGVKESNEGKVSKRPRC